MKLKIVIKVEMNSDKQRTKAMKIAAVSSGVNSVKIAGEYKDQLEVAGDGVDPVCLANKLRKKVGFASIQSVEEEKDKDKDKDTDTDTDTDECTPSYSYCTPSVPYVVINDPYPNNNCSIM